MADRIGKTRSEGSNFLFLLLEEVGAGAEAEAEAEAEEAKVETAADAGVVPSVLPLAAGGGSSGCRGCCDAGDGTDVSGCGCLAAPSWPDSIT